MRKFELTPTNGRKSFNGKAYVEIDDEGNQTLYSYNTPIIRKDSNGVLHRLYSGFTSTTGTHIKAFCNLDKKGFLALPVEEE